MKTNYKNYFKKHLGYSYSEKDILSYRKWFYAQYKFLKRKIRISKKDRVLEIGSGIGGFYSFVKDEVGDYFGAELDNNAVEFSNKHYKTREFSNVPFESIHAKKFDKIFAFEVLEHLENPIESISKIHSLLDKDGIFCGTSPYPFAKNVLADESHIYVLNPENWKRLFMQAGFKDVKLYPLSFLPVVWRVNKRFNIRIPFYVPFYGFISTCLIIAKK